MKDRSLANLLSLQITSKVTRILWGNRASSMVVPSSGTLDSVPNDARSRRVKRFGSAALLRTKSCRADTSASSGNVLTTLTLPGARKVTRKAASPSAGSGGSRARNSACSASSSRCSPSSKRRRSSRAARSRASCWSRRRESAYSSSCCRRRARSASSAGAFPIGTSGKDSSSESPLTHEALHYPMRENSTGMESVPLGNKQPKLRIIRNYSQTSLRLHL